MSDEAYGIRGILLRIEMLDAEDALEEEEQE